MRAHHLVQRVKVALIFSGCHRRGGVERSVWEMARHLRHAHDVTVVAQDIDPDGLDGVELISVPASRGGALRPLAFAASARKILRGRIFDRVVSFGVGDVGADVLWVNSVHRAWLQASTTMPSPGGRDPRLRYLLPRHRVLLAMETWYFTRQTTKDIVVVADQVGQDLTRLYGVNPSTLLTIHNGFAPDEFSLGRRLAAREEARAVHGYRDDDVVLLMAANELDRKGYAVTLRAMSAVGSPRPHLLLVGRADPARFSGLVAELGLQDRVRYGGSTDMAIAHAAADVFVLPTQYEAFCLAIVEALGSGLPVVTSRVPGAGDVVRHGESGLLLDDPTDVTELAAVLNEVLDDERRSNLAAGAAPSVAHLTWSALFDTAEAALLQPDEAPHNRSTPVVE